MAGVSKVGAFETHERTDHAWRGWRSEYRTQIARPDEVRSDHAETGVTHDTVFERRASKVWNYGAGLCSEVSLKDFRKDIIIEVYNGAGQLALAYKVHRCWVSDYQAIPELDANAVAIQTIKLENEGWE